MGTDAINAYCTCAVDAMRRNFQSSGDPAKAQATADQIKRCGAAARAGSPSPFALASPRDTGTVWDTWSKCVTRQGDKNHGVYCDCVADFDAAMRAGGNTMSPDIARTPLRVLLNRCRVADQYWVATKTHLTVRQFKNLIVDP